MNRRCCHRVAVARQSRKCVTSCPFFGGVWCSCRTKTPQNRTVYTANRVCRFLRPSCGAARERRRASFGGASSNRCGRVLRRRTRRERARRRQTRVRRPRFFGVVTLFAHIQKMVSEVQPSLQSGFKKHCKFYVTQPLLTDSTSRERSACVERPNSSFDVRNDRDGARLRVLCSSHRAIYIA